jgi:hypothetical protein
MENTCMSILSMDFPVLGTIYFSWISSHLSKKSFRYAGSALSLAFGPMKLSESQFLGLCIICRQSAIKAIEASSLVEVFVSSYVLLLLSLRMEEPFHTSAEHFHGICAAFSELMKEMPRSETLYFAIRELMRVAFRILLIAYLSSLSRRAKEDPELIGEAYLALRDTTLSFCPYSQLNSTTLGSFQSQSSNVFHNLGDRGHAIFMDDTYMDDISLRNVLNWYRENPKVVIYTTTAEIACWNRLFRYVVQ